MDSLLEEKIVTTNTGNHDTFAHYANKKEIGESFMTGKEIVALCGKKWRPEKDFTKYPVCGTCKDIYESLSA